MDYEHDEFVEEMRILANLTPYPKQHEFFGDAKDSSLKTLAKDIDQRGLQNLPEILPDNRAGLSPDTTLLGHHRVLALILLGYVEHPVIVRYDLAEASLDEIEREFLCDNLMRRHQSKLAQARIYKRLLEIERAGREKRFTRRGREIPERPLGIETRDLLARQFDVSGRTLDRWCRVLELPLEIQQAVENERLPLTVAAGLASLKRGEPEKVAAEIRGGMEPRKAVAKHTPKPPRADDANKSIDELMKALIRAHKSLPGQLSAVTRTPGKEGLQVLSNAKSLLDDVAAKLKDNEAAWRTRMRATVKELDLH
jgi:hypothetical protein